MKKQTLLKRQKFVTDLYEALGITINILNDSAKLKDSEWEIFLATQAMAVQVAKDCLLLSKEEFLERAGELYDTKEGESLAKS